MPGINYTLFSPSLTRSLSEKSLEMLGAEQCTDRKRTTGKRRYVLVRCEGSDLGSPERSISEDVDYFENSGQIEGHLATEADTEILSMMLSETDVPLSPALNFKSRDKCSFLDSRLYTISTNIKHLKTEIFNSKYCSRLFAEEAYTHSPCKSPHSQTKPQSTPSQKPGGPCDHCGALESPQWRRGPVSKPMLCNACGTRYRRTTQLGPSVSAAKTSSSNRSNTSNHVPSNTKRRPGSHSLKCLTTSKKTRCGLSSDTSSKTMLAF
mmetsp:Transcript_12542/g.17135  ORF Transcript_12542/g.17135 Transcript_12542/m.17135 type:complete len:265 (+) Transcript_12542:115-909(+)